jgi:hypothetical protein
MFCLALSSFTYFTTRTTWDFDFSYFSTNKHVGGLLIMLVLDYLHACVSLLVELLLFLTCPMTRFLYYVLMDFEPCFLKDFDKGNLTGLLFVLLHVNSLCYPILSCLLRPPRVAEDIGLVLTSNFPLFHDLSCKCIFVLCIHEFE